jgi:hypothetical protein
MSLAAELSAMEEIVIVERETRCNARNASAYVRFRHNQVIHQYAAVATARQIEP